MPELASIIWADGPSTQPQQPPKSKIRAWGAWLEGLITAFTSNGGLIYSSLALLNADLAHAANSMAWVYGDATVANNGVYGKVGASGVGSWTRRSDLPFSFIIANDAGAGTPNAIIATTAIPVVSSALVWMNVADTNTSSPVTVQFNGGAVLTIKANSGNDIIPDGLIAGMIILGIVSGTTFRLISDQASAAFLAAAEAARDAALAAQAAAEVARTGAEAAQAGAEEARDEAVSIVTGGFFIQNDVTYTIGSGQTYATIAAALTALKTRYILPGVIVTLAVVGHVDCGASIGIWQHVCANQIRIRPATGSEPLTPTLTGVQSVTGSRGNYSVTYNFSSVAGISVGDVLLLKDFPQSFQTQGGQAAPQRGGWAYGLTNAGIMHAVATVASGTPTTITLSGGTTPVFTTDMIVVFLGQIRKVTAVAGSTITVNAAFKQFGTSIVYYMLLATEAGTMTVSSGNATGTGTAFLSRANPGDTILIADGNDSLARVNSVSSDTALAFDRTFTVGSGSYFAIINHPGQHEGAFKVTAVDAVNNRVTVANLSKAEWLPGVRGFTSATAKVIRATLFASADGIQINAPKLDIDDVGIVGTAGVGNGISADGQSGYAISSITLGAGTPVIGWNVGVNLLNGSNLYAQEGYLCGNTYAGLNIARATADLDSAFACGNGQYGVVGDCGGFRASRLHANCNTIGFRQQVGGNAYSDWSSFAGNSEAHILSENKSFVQFVGATCLHGGRSGSGSVVCFDAQNGGGGRITGLSCIGNYGGTNIAGSGTAAFEMHYATLIANNGIGINPRGVSVIEGDAVGVVGNTGQGIYVEKAGQYAGNGMHIRDNKSGGVISTQGGKFISTSAYSDDNATYDYTVSTGGYLLANAYLGTPVFGATLNKILGGGALVTDGSQVSMGP